MYYIYYILYIYIYVCVSFVSQMAGIGVYTQSLGDSLTETRRHGI